MGHSDNWQGSVDFFEGSCMLASKLDSTDSEISDLVSYVKGVFVFKAGEVCNPLLTRGECKTKAEAFGQTVQIISPSSTDAPKGCFRDAESQMFYWSDAGAADCSPIAECFCG